MADQRPNISDAEWRVMHEIWQTEPVNSGVITTRLAESTDWSPGTIKTLLHRLVQKGILDFRRKGNRYLYTSNFTEPECVDQASEQLLHTVFQGRPVSMLAYLVESSRLSGSEVETLRAMLDEIRADLPTVDGSPTSSMLPLQLPLRSPSPIPFEDTSNEATSNRATSNRAASNRAA